MILFVQNLCSATREVLKCTTRYSSSFEEDGLLGLIRLGFRSPLDMLPGGLLSGGASPRAAYQSAALSAAHATQQPNGNLRTTRKFPDVAPSLGVPDATDKWGAEEIAKLKQ